MDFIDTHQHLIYRQRFGYAWTAGIPALAEGDFTVGDYREVFAVDRLQSPPSESSD